MSSLSAEAFISSPLPHNQTCTKHSVRDFVRAKSASSAVSACEYGACCMCGAGQLFCPNTGCRPDEEKEGASNSF